MSNFPFYAICVSDQAPIAEGDSGEIVAAGPADRSDLIVTVGRTYKIVGEDLGMYVVVNNLGSTSLHPKSHFRRTGQAQK